MTDLKSKKIVISTHVYTTGPAQDLKEYLIKNKVGNLLFIGHPLFFDSKLQGSGYELYRNGNKLEESYGKIRKYFELISYLRAFFLNIFWVMKIGKHWDLYVGSDNLNTLSGLVLKYFGLVDKVVYYVIDYNPCRFKNKLLNRIYHQIDQGCVKYSDETWNLSPRMISGRKRYFSFSGGDQKIVPVGVWFKRIKRVKFDQIRQHTLVFMGHITEKQGIQRVIEAMPQIVKRIPDFRFLIIGGGNYLPVLRRQVKNLKLGGYVIFTGYIENHQEIEEKLAKCGIGIALYEKYVDEQLSFSYFADSGKIKSFLACGLPVIIPDFLHNSKEIERKKCGIVIDKNGENLESSIIKLMNDKRKLQFYRENAVNYARQFDWDKIFKKSLEKML